MAGGRTATQHGLEGAGIGTGSAGRVLAILVLDAAGIIVDSWTCDDSPRVPAGGIGKPWADVVSTSSRMKVVDLLSRAEHSRNSDQSEIDGLLYSAIRLDHSSQLIAIAHEGTAAEGHDALADDGIVSRLFHFSNEALIMVRTDNLEIAGANEACGLLIGKLPEEIAGARFDTLLQSDDTGAITSLVSGGEPARRTTAIIGGRSLSISALPPAGTPSAYALLRLDAAHDDTQHFDDLLACATLKEMLVNLPDALAAIDQTGKILMANQAFVNLVMATSETGIRLSSIGRWLGPTEDDAHQLVNRLAAGETISDYRSVIWTENGSREEVELSAIPAPTAMPLCYALLIRKQQPSTIASAPGPAIN